MTRSVRGRGKGLAFSRYKNRAAYLALVAEVEVDEEVRLRKVWCAVDGGLVINPDGAINQVEGGIVQAASWTLKEQVRFADGRVATATWADYPILRFSEVPEIEVRLVGSPHDAAARDGRGRARPDRRRHRQRRRPRPRRPPARPAADARAPPGGDAGGGVIVSPPPCGEG